MLLQPAINLGLSEFNFWDMTISEVERFMEGAVWQMKLKAQFDYSLANLIGTGVCIAMGGNTTFPTLEEAYPSMFEDELKQQQEQQQLEEIRIRNSQNRFMEFALKHNSRMKKGVNEQGL